MHKVDYKNFIIYLLLCWLVLLPLLFFPLSGDLALFLSSVRVMDHGGLPYKDLIDIKPPLLFYAFQAMTKIFGNGEYGVRLFDFIAQSIVVSMLYLLIFKSSKNKIPAFASGILYSMAYTVLNFNNTTQIESLLGICILPIIYFQVYHRVKIFWYLPLAFLIGIFSGMKYTLGIMLAAMLFDDMLFAKLNIKLLIKKYAVVSFGFISAFLLGLYPYLNSDIYNGFKAMSSYFGFYASQPQINSISIKYMLGNLSIYFGDIQSIFLFTLFIIGFIFMIKNDKEQNKLSETLRIAFLLLVGLFFACMVERKLFIYHLSRMNSAFAIFWAVGAYSSYKYYMDNKEKATAFTKFAAIAILIFFIPLSPFPRWSQLIQLPYTFYTNTNEYNLKFERPESESILRIQHLKVADYINKDINYGDKVINASTGSSMLNYLFNTANLSKFCQSSYYVFPKASSEHINEFADEIKTAKFVIIQTNDRHYHINGVQLSTFEVISKIPKIKNPLDSLFVRDSIIGNFVIYRKKYAINRSI